MWPCFFLGEKIGFSKPDSGSNARFGGDAAMAEFGIRILPHQRRNLSITTFHLH
jgi:hypothetical protein